MHSGLLQHCTPHCCSIAVVAATRPMRWMPKACVCVAIVAALLAVHSAASLLLPESKAADPLAAKLRFGLIARRRFPPTAATSADQNSTAL